jgi:hypothetical protein
MPKTNTQINERRSRFRAWQSKLPYFIGAILLHLIVFLMLATWVIFKAPVVLSDSTNFQAVKIASPPPPPPAVPQMAGGEAQNALEPDVVVTPPQAVTSVVTVNSTAAFNVSSVRIPQPTLPSITTATGSALSDSGASGAGKGVGSASSVFGSDNNNGNGMTGYFYDLKQTPDHKPTDMSVDSEQPLMRKFFSQGWNENDWATKFLKSPKPLYANEIMVPLEFSQEGPKSFGLEKVCEPGYWAAIYHLKINAARSGNFRVAGYGDDFLVVRINGDVVLDSGYYPPVTNFKRIKIYPSLWFKAPRPDRPDYAQTVVGNSFHVDPGESVTIDVLIGDAYAPVGGKGICGYFLFLLEEGKDYPNDAGGNPIFPLFQIQPNADLQRKGEHPPFTSKPEDALLSN